MRILASFILLPLLAASALAQNAQQPPPKVDMPSGHEERSHAMPTVGEAPDQIRVKNIIGAPLYGRSGKRLGTIRGVLINRQSSAIELYSVDAGSKRVTVPFASARFEARPTPRFVTDLGEQDLAGGQSFKGEAKKRPDFYALPDQLLNKTATAQNGEKVGEVKDAIASLKDGHMVALVVATGLYADAGHVVPWQSLQPQDDKSGSVHLALAKDQVDNSPTIASRAPEPAEPTPSVGSSVPERSKSTTDQLNTGSTPAPAPAVRRK